MNWHRALALVAAVTLGWQPAAARNPQENGAVLAGALAAAQAGNWDSAQILAAGASDPVVGLVIDWTRLRAGRGNFAEYEHFLTEHADWPGLAALQRAAESEIPPGLGASRLTVFFGARAPQTGAGLLALVSALTEAGRTEQAAAAALAAWQTQPLDSDTRAALLATQGANLAPHHASRLENLLWAGHTDAAEAMLPLVTPERAALARARIALQRGNPGVDALIAAIPPALANDGGLAHDRFQWRRGAGLYDSAADLLLSRDTAALMGRPEAWSDGRRSYARRAMRAGDARSAYLLASAHQLTGGSDYADLEWLAGYVALRHLNDPARALAHFARFEAAVQTPISLGRAGYWTGRAQEAAGNPDAARAAYAAAARHQTSFYGQLAAERLGLPPDPALAGAELPPDWTRAAFLNDLRVRAGILLHYANEPGQARWFFTHAGQDLDSAGRAALAQLALDLNMPHTALAIAKDAAASAEILPAAYYPLTALAEATLPVPAEMALAIARQESEFLPGARSPVGALGLMQVMPATGRAVAAQLDIAFSETSLLHDPAYNARIGSAYLAGLLDTYDGNILLAAAAYNAGPGRVRGWIAEFGDPRDPAIDPVDWVETIPFNETRNYVQRVAEALHVYRARLTGQPQPLRLTQALGHKGG